MDVPTVGENLAAMRKIHVTPEIPALMAEPVTELKSEPVKPEAEPIPEPKAESKEPKRYGFRALPAKSEPVAIPGAKKLAPRRFGFTTPNLDKK